MTASGRFESFASACNGSVAPDVDRPHSAKSCLSLSAEIDPKQSFAERCERHTVLNTRWLLGIGTREVFHKSR